MHCEIHTELLSLGVFMSSCGCNGGGLHSTQQIQVDRYYGQIDMQTTLPIDLGFARYYGQIDMQTTLPIDFRICEQILASTS